MKILSILGLCSSLLFQTRLLPNAQANEIWMQPTEYLGPRNNNPYLQAYFGTIYEDVSSDSYLLIHYESEMIGTRHDFTFDVDRAFYRNGDFFWGRAHVWDLSGFKARNDRWGMLAQFQPINLGIQLNPMLIGPIGLHYFKSLSEGVKIAFSVSPLAVPNLGSEVTLNESSVSTNRFGRLPPGTATVNGTTLPIRYQINTGNIFTDVLLKPNFSGFAAKRFNARSTLAFGFSYAPDPNPTAEVTSSFVQAGQDQLTAVAVVHPQFLYHAQSYLSETYSFPESEFSLEADALIRSGTVTGLELIARFANLFYVAYAQSYPSTEYLDHLCKKPQRQVRRSLRRQVIERPWRLA